MKINASVRGENSNSIEILSSHTQSISIRIHDIMTKNEDKIDEGEGGGVRLLKWHHFFMIINSISIHPFI